jgi:hypothetical protein
VTPRQQDILGWLIPCALSDLYLWVDVWMPTVSKWLGIESVAPIFWISDPLLDFIFDVNLSTILYNAIFSDHGRWIFALYFLPQPWILIATIVLTIQLFQDPK